MSTPQQFNIKGNKMGICVPKKKSEFKIHTLLKPHSSKALNAINQPNRSERTMEIGQFPILLTLLPMFSVRIKQITRK